MEVIHEKEPKYQKDFREGEYSPIAQYTEHKKNWFKLKKECGKFKTKYIPS